MLDYPSLDYAHGDVGNPNSFPCNVVYEQVPGLDFMTCQQGIMNNELESKIEAAVKGLEARGAGAIIGDCGFMLHYHRLVTEMTDVPVLMSSVCQLPLMQLMLGRNEKIAILTANCATFKTPNMHKLLVDYGVSEKDRLVATETEHGEQLENDRVVVVGLKDLPGFDAITHGWTKDCDLIEQSLIEKMSYVLEEHPEIKGILSECTMIPGYSQAMRDSFNMPVLDAMTAVDILLASRKGSSVLSKSKKAKVESVSSPTWSDQSSEEETMSEHRNIGRNLDDDFISDLQPQFA